MVFLYWVRDWFHLDVLNKEEILHYACWLGLLAYRQSQTGVEERLHAALEKNEVEERYCDLG